MKGILIGLFVIGLGLGLLVYSNDFVKFFGISDWAETKLGSTRNIYVLLGMFCVGLGCLFLFGFLDTKKLSNGVSISSSSSMQAQSK